MLNFQLTLEQIIELLCAYMSDFVFQMTDFERIRRSCMKRGELWEDPDFPATQTSVFYHQTPPFQFVWKRPKVSCIFIAVSRTDM